MAKSPPKPGYVSPTPPTLTPSPTPPYESTLPIAVAVKLTPAFKVIFITVSFLTVLSLAVSVALVLYGKDTEDTRRLVETCSTTWKLGFGASVGLMGGKVL
jgi:hypothetical protein